VYPEHFTSYYLIEAHCLLETYCVEHGNITQEGGVYIAHGLSEADEEWLQGHGIRYELRNDDLVA
jgi:hypothetical protein